MKTREQNRHNKRTEIERFDWFIERIQTRVAFGWLSERSGWKNFTPENFLVNKSNTIFKGLHSYRPYKWRHKMFKTQVKPRAAGEWFHCKVWNILMCHKSVDHRKSCCGQIVFKGAIHSTKISGDFGPKLNGSVRSNRKSFEKTGPPFEVDHFSLSDRSEFWLNGSCP